MTQSNQQSNSTVKEMQKYFGISDSGVTLPYVTITLERAAEFIEERYLPRKQVEEAIEAGIFIDLSKTRGEMVQALRQEIRAKLSFKEQQ